MPVDLRAFRFALLGVLVFSVANAVAQTESAAISGRITDQSGAVVAGAEVQLQSVERGTSIQTTANAAGIYSFPAVQPGQYHMTVRKAGFRLIEFVGLVVNVQDHIDKNFQLQVGSVTESVTVTGGAPLVNTEGGAVSTVVDRNFTDNLPMNGRSFQTLIQLTPGVVVAPSTPNEAGQFSVNGQRTSANYWMVDGVSGNIGMTANPVAGNSFGGGLGSFSAGGGTNSLISIDALQEFRIQTSTYAPEFGRTPGAQIEIVTRSGTNQFHGTAFDYLRNDLFDANDWFADNKHLPKPAERQNDFGGVLGGPIFRDRAFFFFSYEGLRLRLPKTALTTVPDASFTPGGTTNSRQNATPALQPFFAAYPLPNPTSPEIFNPCDPVSDPSCPPSGMKATGSAAFDASYSDPSSLDAYSLRIDDKLSSTVAMFARYNYSPSRVVLRGIGASLAQTNDTRIKTQTATLGATWTISPLFTTDLRFNFSQTDTSGSWAQDSFGGAIPLGSLPFPSPFGIGNSFFSLNIFSLTNDSGLLTGPIANGRQRQFNLVGNAVIQRGSHSVKFGADFRRLSPSLGSSLYGQSVAFEDVASAEQGDAFFSTISTSTGAHLILRNLGAFAQDTWRVNDRLTMTYGVRWDVDFAPVAANGPNVSAVTGFSLRDFSNLALAPAGTAPFKTTYGNVAPRVGLAYQLSATPGRERVVRGGFGSFFDLITSNVGGLVSPLLYPFGADQFVFGPFPIPTNQASPPSIMPPDANQGILFGFDPHMRLPYSLEWNAAIEQAFGKQALTLSYLGSTGRRLQQTARLLSPNPNYAQAFLTANSASSTYSALQVQFKRHLSRGLQSLASYVWSHSIDDGSYGSYADISSTLSPVNSNANRASSDFDIRRTLSVGLTYDLPAPRGSPLWNLALHGWSLQTVLQARTAPPIDLIDGNVSQQLNNGVQAAIRPDLVPGQPLYLTGGQCEAEFVPQGFSCAGGRGLNPAAFTDPPVDPITGNPQRQGTVPRNLLRAFGATQWDFGVHREFRVHEAVKLQFRAELFNILNHPNFGAPVSVIGENGFGVSTSTLANYLDGGKFGPTNGSGAFNPLYQLGGPRSTQFALKLIF